MLKFETMLDCILQGEESWKFLAIWHGARDFYDWIKFPRILFARGLCSTALIFWEIKPTLRVQKLKSVAELFAAEFLDNERQKLDWIVVDMKWMKRGRTEIKPFFSSLWNIGRDAVKRIT